MNQDYNSLLLSRQWQHKRKSILLRDNYKCRCCGSSKGLQVHHRQYHIIKECGNFKQPWKYADKYLITLCDKCHSSGHSKFKVPVFTI
jgi:5-methylcytosine-specific restriction endonuclease McrA